MKITVRSTPTQVVPNPAAPAGILSVTITPNTPVVGGATIPIGQVTLTGPAPTGGQLITLVSSNPSAAAVSASFTIPAGSVTGGFGITTLPVTASTTATITASTNSTSKTATIVVLSPGAPPTDPIPTPPPDSTPVPSIVISDVEFDLMTLEPPTLLAEDPESYYGTFRKVMATYLQKNLVDPLAQWNLNLFADTVDGIDIVRWEKVYGIPSNDTLSLVSRRAAVGTRMVQEPFTHARRNNLVARYMVAPVGDPAALTPDGIPLTVDGIPLFNENVANATVYRIYEDAMRFVYVVRINNGLGVDAVSLLRDLQAVTPAGIGVTLSPVTNVLDYKLMTLNLAPVWYSRFNGNANDETAFGDNGVLTVAPTALATPGLLDAAVGDAGYTFNGTSHYVTIPTAPQMRTSRMWAFRARVRPATSGYGAGVYGHVFSNGAHRMGAKNNQYFVGFTIDGVYTELLAPASYFASGTTRTLLGKLSDDEISIYIDGLKVASMTVHPQSIQNNTNDYLIGRNQAASNGFWNGAIDEPAIFDHDISDSDIYLAHRTGINQLS